MSGKLVLTVGSVLRGDDAAGAMLAKLMTDTPIAGWSVIDGGQTPEDELAPIRRIAPDFLLLVDAAEMGLEAGAVRLLDESDVRSDYLITTHSLPLSFLLGELQSACGEVLFLGIQAASTEFMGPLHPQVHAAVEDIYAAISTGADIRERYSKL